MKRSFFVAWLVLVLVLLPSAAFAQTGGGGNAGSGGATGGGTTLINPLGQDVKLVDFLKSILDFIVKTIAPIIIILMLVYIGFLFATTSVNPENKQKAREYLLWTVIGALILLGAVAISEGIQATVNALSTGA